MKDLISDIKNAEPDPQESAIEAGKNNKLMDSEGTLFDPDIHATDKAGAPVVTLAGTFRKRSGPKPNKKDPQPDGQPDPERIDAENKNSGSVAEALTSITFLAGSKFFGENGMPKSQEEITEIQTRFDRVLAPYGMQDIPPWADLAIVLTKYAGSRAIEPASRTHMQKAIEKIKAMFSLLGAKIKTIINKKSKVTK